MGIRRWNRLALVGFVIGFGFGFGFATRAQNLTPIETEDIQHQLGDLNHFQRDCLTLIRAPHFFFKGAETYPAKQPGTYFVRVSGQLENGVKVEFRQDRLTYVDKNGVITKKNFHLRKEKIAVEDDHTFSFVFLVPGGKGLLVPLIFHQEIDQKFDLHLSVDENGLLKRALLEPIPDADLRNKLCVRSRLALSVGVTAFSYDQHLQSVGGAVNYLSAGSPSFSLGFNYSRDPIAEDSFSIRSAPGKINASQSFQSDFAFRWTTFAYAFQQRPRDWVQRLGPLRLHPFYRYGAELHNFPLLNITGADQASLQYVNMLNAAGGVGLSLFSEHDWMAEFYMNLQYPLYTSVQSHYAMMFDGSLMLGYCLTPNVFTGLNWYGQFHQFRYQRGGLDSAGQIQFVTSSLELALGWVF